jgi:hypothetical protein
MHEERPLTVSVECHAGHRGEQTPRTLILGDRRIDVAEVVDAWLAPEYRYFKLKGKNGDTYLVRHDEAIQQLGADDVPRGTYWRMMRWGQRRYRHSSGRQVDSRRRRGPSRSSRDSSNCLRRIPIRSTQEPLMRRPPPLTRRHARTPGSAESESPVETLLFGKLIFSLYLLFIGTTDGKGPTTFTFTPLRRSRNLGEERVAISEP